MVNRQKSSYDIAAMIFVSPRFSRAIALVALAAVVFPSPILAATPSSLIKGSASTVYYRSADNRRFVFPNASIFASWYTASSTIMQAKDEDLSTLPLGGNVTYRPGVKLVKITTDPKVYAVSRYGILRWITTEQLATDLYGANWNKNVADIPDTFFINYTVGAPITSTKDFSVADEQDAALVPQANIKSSQPALALNAEPTKERVEISYFAPFGTSSTVAFVDGTRITDPAIAMCKGDCSITLQVNIPGNITAFTTVSTSTLQSNTIIVSPE